MGFFIYEYDYRGNRVRQEMVGSQDPTVYLWDEFSRYGDVILEMGVNPDLSLYRKMDYTLARGMLISQTNLTGNTHYFLQDAQNSTVALTDAGTGDVYQNYSYNAFGELQGNPDPLTIGTNYLYTGQQFDPVYTELHSLRARYYDPSMGRFMTRDTWAYDYQNPVELNRYVYTANNPVTYIDPSGNASLASYVKLIAKSTAGSAVIRGVVGGVSNVIMEYIFAWLFQTEAQPLIAFGEGFVGGVTGSLVGNYIKAGKILKPLLELLIDAGVGVAFDVGARGEDWRTSVLFNLGAGAVGFGLEQLGRKAAPYIVKAFPSLGKYFNFDVNNPHAPDGSSPDAPDNPSPADTGGNGTNGDGHNGVDGDGSGGSNVCGLNSFSADTTVQTSDGDVPISEIEIGDTVIAYDEETGQTGEYTVTDTINHVDEDIIHLTIDGELLETTAEHPFYTDDGVWVNAADLIEGELVLSLDGNYGTAEAVILLENANQAMYNLTVEEVHTFAVGDGDWVVHNVCRWQKLSGFADDILAKGFHFNWTDRRGNLLFEITLTPDEITQDIIVGTWSSTAPELTNKQMNEVREFLENNLPQAIERTNAMEILADQNGWIDHAFQTSILRHIFQSDLPMTLRQ